ncbi:MAG: hypothetical protein OEY22_00995 [Candidatus Bathyarchaeota archaeon]|nr:hypothetical protein [Candidatus Bathyarchaeota archaeon]
MTFLATLIASGAFLGGLNLGLFESMTILEDSIIDISNSVITLHIRNTGLSDIQITELTFVNMEFTIRPSDLNPIYLPRGAESYLQINYAEERFSLHDKLDSIGEHYNWERDDGHYTSIVGATPLTFHNGSTYSVTFHTNSLFHHSFPLEARLTSEESLELFKQFTFKTDSYVDITLYLNNTGATACYIYTIQIVNVTFRFRPALAVWIAEGEYPHYSPDLIITISSAHDKGFGYKIYEGSWMHQYEITAEPTPTISMFQENETYKLTFLTMGNKYYVFNTTIIRSP